MTDRTKPGEQVVNIGLSEILARAEPHAVGAVAEAQPETAVYALADGDLEFGREFVSLAEARKWGVLVSRAEETISNQEDIEARLWWIRGHLGALSLPVSLLAAPFETVCRQLRPEDAIGVYRNLISEIGEIMLTRLRAVGDTRQVKRVSEALIGLGLGSLIGPARVVAERRDCVPPIAPVFAQSKEKEEPHPAAPDSSSTNRLRAIVIAAVCSIVVLVMMALVGQSIWPDGSVSVASETFVSQSTNTAQQWPQVKAREVSGSLGALYYSLSGEGDLNTDARLGKMRDVKAPEPQVAVPARDDNVPNSSKEPQHRKEVVRTDGPLEPREIAGAREVAPPVPPQLPEPELAWRGDGTGVEQGEQRSDFPDGVAATSSNVKVVLVRTHVLVNGSFNARVLSILEPGDRVEVEGALGRWLRIRSRKGKVGYVFASDVGDVEDFTSQKKGPGQ